jgi:hypothetical protein
MRAIGMVVMAVSLSAHAATLAHGRWRITVHSPYLNTTYAACYTGSHPPIPRQPGQTCHLSSWSTKGRILRGQEVCRQAMPNGESALTNIHIMLIVGNNGKSYSGRVRAQVHTPMGVFASRETLIGRWMSADCKRP